MRKSFMANILTLDEMLDRYDGEWVMIAYTETDPETLEVLRGEVLAHSLNAQDVYAAMPIAQGRGVAFEFFGHIPENVAFIL
jgi:hypothetical protein